MTGGGFGLLASLLLLPLTASLEDDLKGLKLVHLVYRHGDRAPVDPYPNDPYKDDSNWPEGFGELTNKGKLRHFKLGQWLRKRYNGFLGELYDPAEIYVRSTDVDRTLMSAESNLAGLFPPQGQQRFNKDLAWQPVPIHTVPQAQDSLLSSHADCPRFTELQEELLRSKEFSDIYEENRELFEYVSLHTGWNITDIVTLDYVWDTLYIEQANNFTLPEWTKKVFPGGKFRELKDMSFLVDTWTPELRRLKGGPFLKELIEHCEQMVEGRMDPPSRRMYMYSGHDTTVAPILHTLDVFNVIAPPYASMIIFELFLRGDYYIRVSYKNESNHEPYVYAIPGCTELCPIEKFRELLTPMLPVDWRAECGFKELNIIESKITFIAALASTVMALVVFVAVCVLLCRRKQQDGDVRYQRIDMS